MEARDKTENKTMKADPLFYEACGLFLLNS